LGGFLRHNKVSIVAVSLTQIKIQADLDASGYIASAQKKAASDQQMIDSGNKLSGTLDQTERKLGTSGSAITRFINSNDAAAKATATYEDGVRRLQAALDRGSISQDQFTRQSQLLSDRYIIASASAQKLQQQNASLAASLQTAGSAANASAQQFQQQNASLASLQTAGSAASASAQQLQQQNASLAASLQSTGSAGSAASASAQKLQQQSASLATALQSTGSSARLSYTELEILRSGAINTIQSLASGEGAFRTLTTQLTQTAPAFGGVLRYLGLTSIALLPIGAAIAVVVAGLGTLAFAVGRLAETQQQIKDFNLTLQSLGSNGQASGADLQKAFEQIRDSGTSASQALASVKSVTQNPLINQARAAELISLARDIASVTGDTLPEAQQKLTVALTGGVDGFTKYAFSLNAITADQAALIRQTGNLSIGLQALHQRFDGDFTASLTTTQRALRDVAAAWNGFLDALGNNGVIQSVVNAFKALGSAIAQGTSGMLQTGAELLGGGAPGASAPLPPKITGFYGSLSNLESGGQNITQRVSDINSQSGVPGQGYFQITDPTWRQFASPDILRQWPSALLAPYAVQEAVVANIPLSRFGPRTVSGLQSQFGTLNTSSTIGQLAGDGNNIASGQTAAQQTDALNKQAEAFSNANKAAAAFGATSQGITAYYETFTRALADGADKTTAETLATNAQRQALAAAGVEFGKESDLAKQASQGALNIADAFIASEAAGLRATAAVQATRDVLEKFGDTASHTAQIEQGMNDILRDQATTAISTSQQQLDALTRTTAANDNLAAASERGAAAVRDAQIANQAAQETQDTLAKAYASGDAALIARAEALRQLTEEQLKANEAAQETTQLNLRTQSTKQDTQLLQLQLDLQGQTSEQIQAQTILLRTKQDLETRFANASDDSKTKITAAAQAEADLVIKVGEAQAAQGRLNSEVQEIANTIENSIGGAIDDVLSGKKITDWGSLFKQTLISIAETVISSELIKPLLGSLVSGVSPQNAQQLGTFGAGGGLVSQLLGIGQSAGGAATSTLGASTTGLGGFINTSIGPTLGFANPALQGPTLSGAALGEGGLFGSTTLGSVLPFAGLAIGAAGLLGSLFGNKTPPTNASGGSIDLSTGIAGGISTSGSGVNASAAAGLIKGLSTALQSLTQATGGSLPEGGISAQVFTNKAGQAVYQLDYSGPLGKVTQQFSSAADAIAAATQAAAQNLTGLSSTLTMALQHISDPSQVQAAVAFAKTYDDLGKAQNSFSAALSQISTDTVEKTGPFETALGAINATFTSLSQSAQQFGLSLDPINQALDSATNKLRQDFKTALDEGIAGTSSVAQSVRSLTQSYQQNVAAASALNLTDADTLQKIDQLRDKNLGSIVDQIFSGVGEDPAKKTDVFTQALTNLQGVFEAATASASQLGLSIDDISARQAAAVERLASDLQTNLTNNVAAVFSSISGDPSAKTDNFTAALQKLMAAFDSATADAAALQQNLNIDPQRTEALARLYADFSSNVYGIVASAEGLTQSSDPLTQALAQIADAVQSFASTAASAGQDIRGIAALGETARAQLAGAFNSQISGLLQAITDPVQSAIDQERAAGRRRLDDAQALGADLDQVANYNVANLQRVTDAAKSSVQTLQTAEQVAAQASSTLADAISSVTGTGVGQFAMALKNLGAAESSLLDAAGKANPNFNPQPILQSYGDQANQLRIAFDNSIQQLIVGINDPVQAALNVELEAGRRRVAEAEAVSGDLAAVDQYNAANLIKVAQAAQQATTAITTTAASFNDQIKQLLEGITDPVQAVIDAELQAGQDRVTQAQSIGADLNQVYEYNRANLIKVIQAAQGAGDGIADFSSQLQSLQSALQQLTTGPLSGLTPAQQVIQAKAQFQSELALVQAGNLGEIPNLTASGIAAVQASQSAYGNSKQTADLRDQITNSLQGVAISTGKQAVEAASTTTVTASNRAQLQTTLRAEDAAAHSILSYLQVQADLQRQTTGSVNQQLRDQIAAQTSIADQLDKQLAQVSQTVFAEGSITTTLQQAQANQADKLRAISAQLQIQADIETARTGIKNNVYQIEATGAQNLANLLDVQSGVQSDQTVSLKAIADQLQVQATIEAASTGVKNNVYQQEADNLNAVIAQLTAQGLSQGITSDSLKAEALAAQDLSNLLQAQADAELRRTGVKNTTLQDEANFAAELSRQLTAQASSQGQLTQLDASRAQLAVALLQQDTSVAAQTVQQSTAGGATAPSAALLAAQQQQASEVAARIGQAQAVAAQGAQTQQQFTAQQQQQQQTSQAYVQQQQTLAAAVQIFTTWFDQFVASFGFGNGDASLLERMLAAVVRGQTITQDFQTTPYLARNFQSQAALFAYNWQTAGPPGVSLDEVLRSQGYATGTGSTRPGWILVGESGPEWMYQQGGNKVLPNGVNPPSPANNNLAAKIDTLQNTVAALLKQTQGGQVVMTALQKAQLEQATSLNRKVQPGAPLRRNVA
jgi:hypothetical protein